LELLLIWSYFKYTAAGSNFLIFLIFGHLGMGFGIWGNLYIKTNFTAVLISARTLAANLNRRFA
jgi:hypothetical protein